MVGVRPRLTGARYCPHLRRYLAPSSSTLYRVMVGLDAAELDLRVGAWLREQSATDSGTWVIALDGKVLRGSWPAPR